MIPSAVAEPLRVAWFDEITPMRACGPYMNAPANANTKSNTTGLAPAFCRPIKPRTETKVPIMQIRHVRAERPLNILSLAHPAISIPITPKISNTKTVTPAHSAFMPQCSRKNVGPQSRTAKRITYTKKSATANAQMIGFFHTCLRMNAEISAEVSVLSSLFSLPSESSGKPTLLGVSRKIAAVKTTPMAAMIPGMINIIFHAP